MQYVYQVWLDVKLFLFSEPLPCQTSLNEMLNEITKVKNTYPIEKATGKLSKKWQIDKSDKSDIATDFYFLLIYFSSYCTL